MYRECAFIPVSIRRLVINILHSAHQEITGMEAEAISPAIWPE